MTSEVVGESLRNAKSASNSTTATGHAESDADPKGQILVYEKTHWGRLHQVLWCLEARSGSSK